jgi:hypothetical protein
MSVPPSPASHGRPGLRRFAIVAATGALLGFVLFCLFGPRVMGWWYTPPAKEAFSCGASVSDALGIFVKFQIGAACAGAALVLVGAVLVRRLFAKKPPHAEAAPESLPAVAVPPAGDKPA